MQQCIYHQMIDGDNLMSHQDCYHDVGEWEIEYAIHAFNQVLFNHLNLIVTDLYLLLGYNAAFLHYDG